MKSEAIVVGAGGHARVVAALLGCIGVEVAGFVDPAFRGQKETIYGVPVVGNLDALCDFPPGKYDGYVAIGDNVERQSKVEHLKRAGYALPAIVHPGARLSDRVRIGEACCVCMGAALAAEAHIGQGVIVNTGAMIDHESDIADFVHLAPGAVVPGRVKIGAGAFVGMGARVAEKLRVGRGAVIGAGSVVLKDVPDGAKVLGVFH